METTELCLYKFGKTSAYHVAPSRLKLNKRISWGRNGNVRMSVLQNRKHEKIWAFGISANPSVFPWPHFRLKARVIFYREDNDHIKLIDDKNTQHRLRRSICSLWRNKAWHGRTMAFLKILSGSNDQLELTVAKNKSIVIDATPVEVNVPKTVLQEFEMIDDAEEKDPSTLSGTNIIYDGNTIEDNSYNSDI